MQSIHLETSSAEARCRSLPTYFKLLYQRVFLLLLLPVFISVKFVSTVINFQTKSAFWIWANGSPDLTIVIIHFPPDEDMFVETSVYCFSCISDLSSTGEYIILLILYRFLKVFSPGRRSTSSWEPIQSAPSDTDLWSFALHAHDRSFGVLQHRLQHIPVNVHPVCHYVALSKWHLHNSVNNSV